MRKRREDYRWWYTSAGEVYRAKEPRSAAEVRDLLRRVIPYLVLKRVQAEAILAFLLLADPTPEQTDQTRSVVLAHNHREPV